MVASEQPVDDPQRQGFDPQRLRRIDDWMQRNIDRGRFSGSSALIARNGRIVYLSAAGLRSLDDGLPYARDTIEAVGGVSDGAPLERPSDECQHKVAWPLDEGDSRCDRVDHAGGSEQRGLNGLSVARVALACGALVVVNVKVLDAL